jgi:hypothetical protein
MQQPGCARLIIVAALLASCPSPVNACAVGPCPSCTFQPTRLHRYLIRPQNAFVQDCAGTDLVIVSPSGTWQGLLRDFGGLQRRWGIQLGRTHVYWTAVAWNAEHTRSWGEVRSLRLGSQETTVLYRSSAWQLTGISLARHEQSLLVQRGERAFSLLTLSSAQARDLEWADQGPRRSEYRGEVRMLGWSSDSQTLWFVAECRRYFRARPTSATVQLIREFADATGCDAFNPDRALGLHVRGDMLWLTDIVTGRSLPVARGDALYPPRWHAHGGFTYRSGGELRYVPNVDALQRWSVPALWAWALGCGVSVLLAAGCRCRRWPRIALGSVAAALGCAVFGVQLFELGGALLGPLDLAREASTSLLLHNELSAIAFCTLSSAALTARAWVSPALKSR